VLAGRALVDDAAAERSASPMTKAVEVLTLVERRRRVSTSEKERKSNRARPEPEQTLVANTFSLRPAISRNVRAVLKRYRGSPLSFRTNGSRTERFERLFENRFPVNSERLCQRPRVGKSCFVKFRLEFASRCAQSTFHRRIRTLNPDLNSPA
jgi:hypothetical protein